MNTKRYKIDGMDCESCAVVIGFALEDAKLENVTVDNSTKELVVPIEMIPQIDKIKEVVDGAGHYTLLV